MAARRRKSRKCIIRKSFRAKGRKVSFKMNRCEHKKKPKSAAFKSNKGIMPKATASCVRKHRPGTKTFGKCIRGYFRKHA